MKERKLSDRKNTFFEDSNAIEYEDWKWYYYLV